MRRKEYSAGDPALLEELAARCPVGFLALDGRGGFPRAVAVNFALRGGGIWFHGALAGDKFQRLAASARVGFTMALPYSVVPSVWSTRDGSACPATQLYVSVEIRGECRPAADPGDKAAGLQALMEKYQPEGGYRTLDAADERYERSLQGVGVFRIEVAAWSAKVRLGQDLSPEARSRLVESLRERGRPLDLATADRIEQGPGLPESPEGSSG